MILAGTGHRPPKLGGYGPRATSRVHDLAEAALTKYKPKTVISGMALGWDRALANAALSCGIDLICAVPFKGQELAWPEESQVWYRRVLESAKQVVIVSEGSYAAAKMQIRNQWMVDHADAILALWDGSRGGTGNCIDYAIRVDKPIINLWTSFKRYA